LINTQSLDGDNNSDSGDKARWVYLVEGGDSGWRVGYQFMEKPYSRGPFNAEKLWYPQFDGQAAYIVPPIANISSGPSGVTYNPGTGLPEKYAEHFFLADFHGDAGSCVHSFAVKPKGASFELVDASLLVKGFWPRMSNSDRWRRVCLRLGARMEQDRQRPHLSLPRSRDR
jgi:quinoprotein glucose dehydrogenase